LGAPGPGHPPALIPVNAFRALGLSLGQLPPGERCSLCDVPGVRVGHRTIIRGEGEEAIRTGVTAVVPPGDLYAEPLPAGAFVLHGHGKAVGLWQLLHLGTLETPILLTSTLAVFRAADALVTWTLARHPKARSVNPVVLECNDGFMSAIELRPVSEGDALAALEAAKGEVEEGCVGAGTGMIAFEPGSAPPPGLWGSGPWGRWPSRTWAAAAISGSWGSDLISPGCRGSSGWSRDRWW